MRRIAFIDISLYSCLPSKTCLGAIYQIALCNRISQSILKPISRHRIGHTSIYFIYPLLIFNNKFMPVVKNGLLLRTKGFSHFTKTY